MEYKPTTIKDIAKVLNLSVSTVSRALKDHPDISAKTKRTVLEAAQALDYHPNTLASGLRGNKTNTIGVIVPKVANYFYSSAISGIEDLAYNAGYRVIICQSDESYEREVVNTRALLASRVDGFLVAISQETQQVAHFQQVTDRHVPLVFFNRVPNGIVSSRVYSDDYEGSYRATQYLIQSGCRTIAHLSGPSTLSLTHNRLHGYLQALQDHGIEHREQLIIGNGNSITFGQEAVERLIHDGIRPDGITAFNDWVAIGALLTLKEKGWRVPGDVSVFGFSNIPSASIVDPPLSTVDQSGFEVGKRAFEMLLKQINGDTTLTPEQATVSTHLIIRKSTVAHRSSTAK